MKRVVPFGLLCLLPVLVLLAAASSVTASQRAGRFAANCQGEWLRTSADWAAVAAGYEHSLALKTDGSLWAWGGNMFGQLGLRDTHKRLKPVRVGTGRAWATISAADQSLALKRDGSLWAWGSNEFGQLGLGDTRNRLRPARVGTQKDWTAIAAGGFHSLGLQSDGSLWAWGEKFAGGLGKLTPTRVGTGNDWTAIAAGYEHSLALKADGSLWAWGWNYWGDLGLGDTHDRLKPTRVGVTL